MLITKEKRNEIVSFLRKFPLGQAARYTAFAAVLAAVLLIAVDQSIGLYVRGDIYADADKVPYRPYGVLLGTSKYSAPNTPNLFYNHRLQSAKTLLDKRKISYLLLSGDNRTVYYNEPRTMARDLKKMGVDEKILFPDYAGFRTLDSIIRAQQVFKVEPMTIITQRFHCERALFIAKYYRIDAICFAADNPAVYSLTRLRETFARSLMLWELVSGKEPHFLGDPEPLPVQASSPEEETAP